MDKWQVIQGRKSEKDKILLYQGKAVAFRDVAMMCIFFMENEDKRIRGVIDTLGR